MQPGEGLLTVPLNDRFAGPFETTGGETALAYDFKVISSGDIAVWRLRDGEKALLQLGVDYTVSGIGEAAGGNVTLLEEAEAGDVYILEGASPLSRISDFAGTQAYKSDAINAEFDRLQRQIVELKTQLDRALVSSRFATDPPDMELPDFSGSPRALIYKDGRLDQATYDEIGVGPSPWAAPVAYEVGLACVVGPPATLAVYDGAGYVCTVAHTASAAAPDPAKFSKISDGALSGPGSTTVNRVPVFDNTGGSLLAQSPVAINKTTGDASGFRDVSIEGSLFATGEDAATVNANYAELTLVSSGNSFVWSLNVGTAGLAIGGLTGGSHGRTLLLRNTGTHELRLRNEWATATAANRFGFGGDVVLQPNDAMLLWHDGTRWRTTRRVKRPSAQIFTSSGTYTPSPGIAGVLVKVQAGGAGGGSSNATATTHGAAGAGGGAGGYAEKWIDAASLGATETVTVGAGGPGGASGGANTGASGGSSSFGAHCSATGGGGGASMASGTAIAEAAGGAGGAGTGGNINITGQAGGQAQRITAALRSTIAGGGGSSHLGRGEYGVFVSGSASAGAAAGTGYGAGGSGAITVGVVASVAGGDGAGGIVIVEEYYA